MTWENADNYKYTKSHTLRDWGWEFVRRNHEYIAEWEKEFSAFSKKKRSPDDIKFLSAIMPLINGLDHDNSQTFEIPAHDAIKWELKSYQNPNARKLSPFNQGKIRRSNVGALM